MLRKRVGTLLRSSDCSRSIKDICRLPLMRVVNPLIFFLQDAEEKVKWCAVAALGRTVSMIAHQDMESARTVVRRLMWTLNSESGSIGWGSAEAMGEIMACHPRLAEEYTTILLSYIDRGENYLENDVLQRGVLWGLGRIAQVQPQLIGERDILLIPFLKSQSAVDRGLAAWVGRALNSDRLCRLLRRLETDEDSLEIYTDGQPTRYRVRQLAAGKRL